MSATVKKPGDGPVVAIVPARLDSRRLPGKAFKPIGRHSLIGMLLDRLAACDAVDTIVVATTARPVDDRLAEWCAAHGVGCFRAEAPVDDVLGRIAQATRSFGARFVVRANGDSPLIAPEAVAAGVRSLRAGGVALVTGKGRYSGLPVGIGPEIIGADALQSLDRKISDPYHREHVTSAVFDEKSEWRWIPIPVPETWRAPELDLTVDDQPGLDWMCRLVSRLHHASPADWSIPDIIAVARTMERETQPSRADHA